jgi:hypothetical protein
MSDLGLLSYYLGIEVRQRSSGIFLCQSVYANKIMVHRGLSSCNPSTSPMESRLKLSKVGTEEAVNLTEYWSVIGVLHYLLHTQPDLAFSVGYLSWFMEASRTDHLAAIKRILWYVVGTRDHRLHYTRCEDGLLKLVVYSDTNIAGDIDTRRSTSEVIFFLVDNPITWQAAKQHGVALSFCEVEYIAAVGASLHGISLARLLTDKLGTKPAALALKVDNQLVIMLSKNPVFHNWSKHIDV